MNSGESSQVGELIIEPPQLQHAEERLRRLREAAVVLNASRRFRFLASHAHLDSPGQRTGYVRPAGFCSTPGGSGLGVRDIGAASYTNKGPELMIAYPLFFDDNTGVSEAHPGSVRGGRVDVPVEPNDGTMLGRHVSDGALVHVRVGGRPAAGHLRSDNWGGTGAVGGGGALGAELNDIRASPRASGHRTGYVRPTGFGSTAGGGRFPFPVCWLWLLIEHLRPTNWGDLRAGGSGSIVSFPSSPPFNGITSAEASSGFTVGGGDALEAELNDMLPSPRSTTRARGHGGSQPVFVDETGGRFLVIHINTPQQGNQGLVAAARGAQDGPGDLAQRALQSVFGGLVPVCFTLLLDDNILTGASPRYIKAATCAGLGLVTGFTYLGLLSKKRAEAAVRVVASTAMAAVSIALVYTVSDNVYIKCTCGTVGAIATVATMAIVC